MSRFYRPRGLVGSLKSMNESLAMAARASEEAAARSAADRQKWLETTTPEQREAARQAVRDEIARLQYASLKVNVISARKRLERQLEGMAEPTALSPASAPT